MSKNVKKTLIDISTTDYYLTIWFVSLPVIPVLIIIILAFELLITIVLIWPLLISTSHIGCNYPYWPIICQSSRRAVRCLANHCTWEVNIVFVLQPGWNVQADTGQVLKLFERVQARNQGGFGECIVCKLIEILLVMVLTPESLTRLLLCLWLSTTDIVVGYTSNSNKLLTLFIHVS